MCGLVGVMGATPLADNVRKAFYDMLVMDSLRGEDSTGVAVISGAWQNPSVELFKSVGGPSDFFYEHSPYKNNRDMTNKPVHVFLGHNRAATQGAVNVANAHPFEFDNLVGAHNGTVQKWSINKFHNANQYDVDSQIIYSQLSHTNVDDVWRDADGAMALSWWDKRDQTLNLIRNNQRTLSFVYSEDDKQVFWSSEGVFTFAATSRRGVKVKDFVQCVPNKLYTFKEEGGVMRHIERDLPPFVYKPSSNTYVGPWGRNNYDDWWGEEDEKTTKVVQSKKKDKTGYEILIITEWHDSTVPKAFGYLRDGRPIQINIPLVYVPKARENILPAVEGDKDKRPFYFSVSKDKLWDSLTGKYIWTNYQHLHKITLKPGGNIIREGENGFRLEFVSETKERKSAPWFGPNQWLTEPAWQHKTRHGCLCCHAQPTWDEAEEIFWFDRENFACAKCQTTPIIQDMILNNNFAA